MIFETDQEPISKPRRKLNWIDAILPTLLGVGGCVLLTYVLDKFFAEYVFMLMFNPASAEYMALLPLAAFVLLILAMASARRLVLRLQAGGTSRFAIECGSGDRTVNCTL
jgi:hypothetical protein